MKKIFESIVYLFFKVLILVVSFSKNKKYNEKVFGFFLNYNNQRIIKSLKKIKKSKLLILLPHCIQIDSCKIKVTSDINNCKECGKCDVGRLLEISREFKADIKIANGGTLARKYIKENIPDLIIAVACERDLISGIFDSFPMPVVGILNIREMGPCYNTKVNIETIEGIIKKIMQEE